MILRQTWEVSETNKWTFASGGDHIVSMTSIDDGTEYAV